MRHNCTRCSRMNIHSKFQCFYEGAGICTSLLFDAFLMDMGLTLWRVKKSFPAIKRRKFSHYEHCWSPCIIAIRCWIHCDWRLPVAYSMIWRCENYRCDRKLRMTFSNLTTIRTVFLAFVMLSNRLLDKAKWLGQQSGLMIVRSRLYCTAFWPCVPLRCKPQDQSHARRALTQVTLSGSPHTRFLASC